MERSDARGFYTGVVLPVLRQRLDVAFPEFGWRRDRQGWVATDQEFTHRMLGVRADRVVAHGPAPRGFLVHGGGPVLWTAYPNGGVTPRGRDFVDTVRVLAERAGVDPAALERPRPRDRRAELLEAVCVLARRELAGERGAQAGVYLERRGFPAETIPTSRLGLMPERRRLSEALERGATRGASFRLGGPRRLPLARADRRLLARRRWQRANALGANDRRGKSGRLGG